jgi:excisionase family DNA binding protein
MDEKRWDSTDLLTVSEAAEALRCSRQTIYRACNEGRIHWFRLREGGAIRIPFFALESLIAPHLLEAAETATKATSEVNA